MSVDVSIVVPVYKAEKYILRLFESITNQTFEGMMEVIFVNDCSPDNSTVILQQEIKRVTRSNIRCKIVNHDHNRGSAATRRTGLDLANGEYVLQVDSDDWIEKDMVRSMFKVAKQEHCDAVCCGISLDYAGGKSRKVLFAEDVNESCSDFNHFAFGIEFGSLANKLISLDFIRKNNIYSQDGITQWDDMLSSCKLRTTARRIKFVNQAFYHYTQDNETSVSTGMSVSGVKEQCENVHLIEQYFKTLGMTYQREKAIGILKLKAKMPLLLDPRIVDVRLWRSIFPEAAPYALELTDTNILTKIGVLLVVRGLNVLPVLIFRLRSLLKRSK